jgi:protein gp37
MSASSAIEWLNGGATWNPTRGCTPCAPECARCYARTFAERWRGVPGHPFERGFEPRTVPDALDLPLRWRKPRSIFIDSVSDLFHDAFPDDYLDQVFARVLADVVFEYGPRHHFFLLTKRADRMREYLSAGPVALLQRWAKAADGRIIVGDGDEWFSEYVAASTSALFDERGIATTPVEPWSHPERVFPLPNLTVGVSVGTRGRRGDLDVLRATPAARRMVSFEPLLEDLGDVDLRGIDVAAIGGESGPGARPCDVQWIRSLVAQCRAAGTAAFVKQLGANVHDRNDAGWDGVDPTDWPSHLEAEDRVEHDEADTGYQGAPVRVRLRDRKGGDPSEWPEDLRVREMPEVRHA